MLKSYSTVFLHKFHASQKITIKLLVMLNVFLFIPKHLCLIDSLMPHPHYCLQMGHFLP